MQPKSLRVQWIRMAVPFIIMLLLVGCLNSTSPQSTPITNPPTATSFQPLSTSIQPSPTATLPTPTSTQPTPTLTATPTTPPPACTERTGSVTVETMPSALLHADLTYRIYLPPCYRAEPVTPYPMLTLLHGQIFTSDQWVRLGATDAADALILSREAVPFIIVMPQESNTTLSPEESLFGDVLVDELLPWVESHYPVYTERSRLALGGISRGAAWAMHIGFTHPDLFAALGAHSLPPFLRDMYSLPGWISGIPQGEIPVVYLDSGRQDPWLADALAFETILAEQGVPHEWYYNAGGHDEAYWQAHTPAYIAWYAAQIAGVSE